MTDSNVVPVPRPALVAGARPTAIVPTTMDEAWRLATAVKGAELAPPGLETPEKIMIAIMTGLEVGLTPMAAIQRIAVINGRTTIWGDGAMALVRASGLCEWVKERLEGDGDARVAVCEVKRKGDPEVTRRMFSVADAKTAGLWDTRTIVKRKGKNGEWYEKTNDSPWHRFPERMLQMRARAFALRDLFADVLGGLYLREEVSEEEEEAAPAKLVAPPPPPPPSESAKIAPPPPPPPATDPVAEDAAYIDLVTSGAAEPDLVAEFESALEACQNGEAFDDVVEAFMPRITDLPQAKRERAAAIHEKHSLRIGS